jgi:asparagine synthetase B (glutamine-hydrolysing)
MRGFFSSPLDVPKEMRADSWLHLGFVRRNRAALRDYPFRVKLFGPLPSFQHGLRTLDGDRKLLADVATEPELLREVRYPYLDRDLLEFMFAIPREQIVRVGQRRSLMKRALIGIVPDELLNRKKTRTCPQEPKEEISTEWPSLAEMGWHIVGSSIGIINADRFFKALQKARRNEEVPIESLKRTLTLESWLRHLTIQGVLTTPKSIKVQGCSFPFETKEIQPSAQPKGSAS